MNLSMKQKQIRERENRFVVGIGGCTESLELAEIN